MIDLPHVRMGLIGAGAIGQTYVEALSLCRHVEVVGVADVRAEAAAAAAERLACASFDSFEEMVAHTDCESAIVCTPPVTHAEVCVWLLHRGLHVLCEKPLAIDVPSAKEMLLAAKEANVTFTMASKFRYVDDVVKAKSLVASGLLGDVVLLENAFTGRVDMRSRWNSNPEVSGGGVLIDNGTHSADVLRYFLGPLAELQVVEGRRSQNLDVEETVRMFVRSANNVMGSVDLSWSIDKELPHFLSIFGSKGTLHVGWQESKYRRQEDKEWTIFGNGYSKLEAFLNQLDNFVAAIRGQEPLRITPEDGLASVEAIEAAYAALAASTWQRIGTEHPQSSGSPPPSHQARLHLDS